MEPQFKKPPSAPKTKIRMAPLLQRHAMLRPPKVLLDFRVAWSPSHSVFIGHCALSLGCCVSASAVEQCELPGSQQG